MSSLYISWVTSSTTIDLGYNTFFVDATSGNILITIPENPGEGTNFMISRTDSSANTVTIISTDGDINGLSTPVSLNLGQNVLLGSSNGHWHTVLGTFVQ
uniref:Uncharacterized protein n=1 Tax=viral metagenome TaxID=1070528 RepID=A0A6C0C9L2_9ZZZZ